MADNAISLVIFVNSDDECVYLYAKNEGKATNNYVAANYRSSSFNDDFFQKFDKILKLYRQKYPNVSTANVSIVLPDHVFLTDTLTVPNMGRRAVENSLGLAIGTVYKNKNELEYTTFPLSQNKQTSVFGLVAVRKDLLERFKTVCEQNRFGVQNITFAANSMVAAATTLNPKLKNSSYVLLDIKEKVARFAFVNKGRTVGTYHLPFGHSMLYKSRMAAEDTLFDHASAELLVLNAKEKAKAKQLTVMGEEILVDEDDAVVKTENNLFQTQESEELELEQGSDDKRSGRKLPKFMLRDTPSDREGFVYENFRIFMKWALELLANNPKITSYEEFDTVYVNMPKEYNFLFNMVNAEEKENKVQFSPLIPQGYRDPLAANSDVLEMFGGLYAKQYIKINNF